jgi:hypothetical protein
MLNAIIAAEPEILKRTTTVEKTATTVITNRRLEAVSKLYVIAKP